MDIDEIRDKWSLKSTNKEASVDMWNSMTGSIHLGPVALKDNLDEKSELFQLFGKRVAEEAVELS